MTNEASLCCDVTRRDRLIAVSGQGDFDSFGQVAHPADAWAQVVAVVDRIRERIERVGADLSDLTKLVVFHSGSVAVHWDRFRTALRTGRRCLGVVGAGSEGRRPRRSFAFPAIAVLAIRIK